MKPKHNVVIVFASIILLAIVLTIVKTDILSDKQQVETNSVKSSNKINEKTSLKFENINFDTSAIVKDQLIADLPSSASIQLNIGSSAFTLTKNSITIGKPSSPDLTISIPSKYLSSSKTLCETLKEANQNRDLGIEAHESQAALLWKYRDMLKYKDCLN